MKMKALLALTAVLAFGAASAQDTTPAPATAQAPTFSDVPAGHWAKDAVDRLVTQGIILGFPDGTYRGTQSLTRYQAAVIIARVLDQIAKQQVPAQQLDPETITSLQNAVQELAADLAALGVRVADLEENSATKEDITRFDTSIEDLTGRLDEVNTVAGGAADAVEELRGQITEINARIDEVAANVDTLSGNYDALRADVDDAQSSIAALNDLTVLLNQDILSLQDRVSALELGQAEFATKTELNALATRVGQVETTLNNRISQVETNLGNRITTEINSVNTRITQVETNLGNRLTTLEGLPRLTFSGNIEANIGRIGLTSGTTQFDVDRLVARTFLGDVFSSGVVGAGCAPQVTAGGVTGINPGSNFFGALSRVSCLDTDQNFAGADVNFTVGVTNIGTTNAQTRITSASATFGVSAEGDAPSATGFAATTVGLKSAQATGTLGGQTFSVRYDNGTDSNSNFFFNPYLFSNDNDSETVVARRGVVFTLNANQLLLAPRLTVVAGSAFSNVTNTTQVNSAGLVSNTAPLQGYYFGVKAITNPFGIGDIGLSYATNADRRDALGLDYNFKIGPASVEGAYVNSVARGQGGFLGTGSDTAFYTNARASFGIVNVGGNFRSIDPDFQNGVAGMSANDAVFYGGLEGVRSKAPYGAVPYGAGGYSSTGVASGEQGFGAAASLDLGFAKVGGYYDQASAVNQNTSYGYAGNGFNQNTFGVNARVGLFAGFSLQAFYNNTTGNGNTIAIDANNFSYNLPSTYQDVTDTPFRYSTGFGARLTHDGKAANALIPNLNINAVFASVAGTNNAGTQNVAATDLQIYADYSAKLGGITFQPIARYHQLSSNNAAVSDSYSTFKVGAQVSTDPFTGIFFSPSLSGGVVTRSTSFNVSPNDPNELYAFGALTFNQFLAPNTSLALGYSYYQASSVGNLALGSSDSTATAYFSASADRIFRSPGSGGGSPFATTGGTASGNLNAFFARLSYNSINLSYILAQLNPTNAASSTAQGFKISTNIRF